MVVDQRLERLYEQVELVKGAGDPRRGKFCVMSFAAFLAGEGHSDRPATASPLLRELAVRVNDALPRTTRQKLKPFVPRIIGTNDGCDGERANMLREAAEAELLPRICTDFLTSGHLRGWRRMAEFRELSSRVFDLTHAWDPSADAHARSKLVVAVASLICFCGAEAPEPSARNWYWNEGIDLLDRMCDIRADRTPAVLNEGRMLRLEQTFARRDRLQKGKAVTDRAVGYLRALLTWPANN